MAAPIQWFVVVISKWSSLVQNCDNSKEGFGHHGAPAKRLIARNGQNGDGLELYGMTLRGQKCVWSGWERRACINSLSLKQPLRVG